MRKTFAAAVAATVVLLGGIAMGEKKGDAAKGKEVYEQCGVCHSADTDEKKMGPSLKGLYKKPAMKNGKKPSDAAIGQIVNKGGNGMPAFEEVLSADEKADLLAYLKTI